MRHIFICVASLILVGCGEWEHPFDRDAAGASDFIYESGNFNPDSIPEIRRLVDAAEAGDTDAQFYVALLRDFYPGNYEPAVREFKRLAAEDHLGSIEMLVLVYTFGKGAEVDYDEAARWLERAAALGSESAARDLANYRNLKASQVSDSNSRAVSALPASE